MDEPISESLNKAFQLAYFIHADAGIARQVVIEAAARLEVAAAAQDKRLYYTPAGRKLPEQSKPQKLRTKISLSNLHLLQRLIYIESEYFERQQEQTCNQALIHEEDMIIRFVKHLIRITMKRNSFHVTLGLSRLLFNYSTPETMDIYTQVIQNVERVRDDYYYRSRKRRLLQEIQDRFGSLVQVSRGQHREERFHVRDNPLERWWLVKRCLDVFLPWKTACVVPKSWDHFTEELKQLAFEGDDPDNEHPIEMNRMHSIIHPDCFSRLTRALNLESPEQRLAIPRFFLSEDEDEGSGPGKDRYDIPELSPEELDAMQGVLAERASRRKAFNTGLLSILVDGQERAKIDLRAASRVRLEVDEDAEMIEVLASGKHGDTLLAAHLLSHRKNNGGEQSLTSSVILEDGQKVSFIVCCKMNSEGEHIGSLVDVLYRETRPLRSASMFLRQLRSRASAMLRPKGERRYRLPALAIWSALVSITLFGLVFYTSYQRKEDNKEQLAERAPGVQNGAPPPATRDGNPPPGLEQGPVSKAPSTPQEAENPPHKTSKPPQPGGSRASGLPSARGQEKAPIAALEKPLDAPEGIAEGQEEATRSAKGTPAAISLVDVKNIYVDLPGSDSFSQQLRNALISALDSTGHFTSVSARERADAVLKGSVRRRSGPGRRPDAEIAEYTLSLVEANGHPLWSSARWPRITTYKGPVAGLADLVVKEIAAKKEEARRAGEKIKNDR